MTTAEIQQYFDENIINLDEKAIHCLNNTRPGDGGINNVIRLIKRDCFGIFGYEDDSYELYYITNSPSLAGKILRIGRDEKAHNALTLGFSKIIASLYSENNLNFLDIANSFQNHKRTFFTRCNNYIVIDSTEVSKLFGDNATAVFLHKPIDIPHFNKLDFYKDIFQDVDVHKAKDDKSKFNKIYILFDERNNLFKIGRSIKPSIRERTLQGEAPRIEMIACWVAPIEIEKELHEMYKETRCRGEWFSLDLVHLKEIDEHMKKFR